jgi:hypothetical protein
VNVNPGASCKHVITPIAFIECESLGVPQESYAQMPTPVLFGERVRVFFSSRNSSHQSMIHFADLDVDNSFFTLNSGKLDLQLGPPGSFDEDGQMPSSIQKIGTDWFMYYIGWNRSVSVPYRLSIGLAKSEDLNCFEKFSEGPVLDRSINNPIFVTTPSVTFENNKFQMFYSKGNLWKKDGNSYESRYSVAYAESGDGVTWENFRDLDFGDDQNFCIARPTPIGEHLVYSRRPVLDFRKKGNGYRLEVSRRREFSTYTKCEVIWDEANFAYIESSYAHPMEIKGQCYIFFNGEGFGKSGIHVARIDGVR